MKSTLKLAVLTATYLLCGVQIASATSEIATAASVRYGISTGCSLVCHDTSSGASPYAGFPAAMQAQIGAGSPTNTATVNAAMDVVEQSYAPLVAVINRLQSPAGDASSFTVPLSPGLNFDGTPASIANADGVWSPTTQGTIVRPAGLNQVDLNLNAIGETPLTRGQVRRSNLAACGEASPDYTVALVPVNGSGFRPTATTPLGNNTVTVCFENVNPTPGALIKTINVYEGTSNASLVGGTLIYNIVTEGSADTDIDSDLSDPAQALTAQIVTAPANAASWVFNSDGSFTYTAPAYVPAGANTDSFVYKVTDVEGDDSVNITVNINITTNPPGNTAPTADDDTLTVAEDSVDNEADVLGNDGDVDAGSEILITGIGTITGPGTATVSADRTKLLVTPNADANDDFTVLYQISDNFGVPASATLTVSITPSPDFPVASDITYTPNPDDGTPAFALDLLDRESVPSAVSDPDPTDTLSVVETSLTALIINAAGLPIPPDLVVDFAVTDGRVTIDPTAFGFLEPNEQAELRFTYTVNDGTGRSVENLAYVTIVGTANGPIRLPGQLANSLSSRYNNHFPQSDVQPEACLSCHLVGMVGPITDPDCKATVNGVSGVDMFNAYGMALCLDRDPTDPPLSNLVARLEGREPDYTPAMNPIAGFSINEDTAIGTVLATATTASNGLTVRGGATTIVTYLLNDDGTYGASAYDGAFAVDDNGALRVAAQLTPGVYQIDIRPVNDAGQYGDDGIAVDGLPGFFPVRADLLKIFTITVDAVPVVTVDDETTAESASPRVIDVTANDTGGRISRVELSGVVPNGTVTVDPLSNALIYTSDIGFTGDDSFDYIAFNAADDPSAAATVTVHVLNVGGLVAIDDAVSAAPAITNVFDVLANDFNALSPTDDPINPTEVTLDGPVPDAGTVGVFAVDGQNITFTPAASFTTGSVSIGYTGTNPGVSGLNASSAVLTVTMLEFDSTSGAGASAIPELAKMATDFLESCDYAIGGGTPGDDLTALINVCLNVQAAINNGENVDDALRALRNEEHFAAVDMTARTARDLGGLVQDRITQIQRGPTRGVDLSGVALTIEGAQIPTQAVQGMAEFLLGAQGQDDDTAFSGRTPWGMFIAGQLSFGTKAGSDTSEGFEFDANNLMVGIDYRASDTVTYGAAIGYASTHTDFGDGGTMTGNGFQLSVFGSMTDFMVTGMALDGFISIGRVAFDSDRAINFTANGVTVDEVAQASFDSLYLNIVPRISYSGIFGIYGDPLGHPQTDLRLTLYASADYLLTYIGDYTETGAGGLNLNVNGQAYHSLIGSVGVNFDRPIYLSSTQKMTLFGGLSFNGEVLDGIRSVTSSFVSAGAGAPEFTISEPGTKGAYLEGDIGVSLEIGLGTLTVAYAAQLQTFEGLSVERYTLTYSTPVGQHGLFNIGASQSAQSLRENWGVDLTYSQKF